ncbi:MAG TPA: SidA/IucD/PvdA family monooxygenase [Thermoanaerobaculia bacterium]|nr:SidA/IucD/PvdA family monooxygenase [Thermoanaerobaculia bacterium]
MRASTYDVLGVGFGPANLALAIALEEDGEKAGGRHLSRLFLDTKSEQVWHPGLLLENSLIQISVLKDLVTIVNPRSRFTFLNYLKEKGRLFEFLNLRDLFPTRLEFNDYLRWVSSQLDHDARFSRQVEAVEPIDEGGGRIERLRVRARNLLTGDAEEYQTRSLVVATGGKPWLPEGVELEPEGRAFHAHETLQRLERDFPESQRAYRFVVIGSGQTGAELFDYLMRRYPKAEVTAAIRRFAFKPVDESDFTNEIFFPENIDFFYGLPDAKRAAFFESLKDVNYAVVDHPLIKRIYRGLYDERARGIERGRVMRFLDLERLSEEPGKVVAHFRNQMTEEPVVLEADGLIVATGYERPKRHPLLRSLDAHFLSAPSGRYKMERDYSIAARPGFEAKVYLQGDCEESHGISETVLSLVPQRAQDILASLKGVLAAEATPLEPALAGC